MSPPNFQALAAAYVCFGFALLLLFLRSMSIIFSQKHKPYPPGPKGWPLIGNLAEMDQLSHRGLANLAKIYGPIFHLRIGFVHMVVVSTPEIARQVLQVEDIIFANRPATKAIKYLTYNRADMAFAHYGPFWRQMRKISVMKLFSRRRAESWDSVRDEVDRTVRVVAERCGTAVNVGELLFGLTRNVIYRAAFGSSRDEGQDEFIIILQEFSKLFGAVCLGDFIPCLSLIDPQGLNSRLIKARAALDGFIDRIIDDHVYKMKIKNDLNHVDNDMVDELLAFYGDEVKTDDDLHGSIKLTRDNIKAIIMDVMFGGTETVAAATEWVMAELMRNPSDLKKVQQELEDVVGLDRKVEEVDFDNLPYFNACLKETLRLHPPIPILPHETAKETEVCGYKIPAKSHVMINIWEIGRDKSSWVDPETFKPSRFFMDGVPDFKGKNFEFIPFGSGRRSCPGMQLGFFTMQMVVAHLLHCFTWELPDGMNPNELDMNEMLGLTAPRASPLITVPTQRLHCPIYELAL